MKKWKLLLYFSVAAIGITCPIVAKAEIVATNKETKDSQDALWELDDDGVLTFENGVIPKWADNNPWEDQRLINTIVIKENVSAPKDSSELFMDCHLSQLDKLDVSNVTNMSYMFYNATLGSAEAVDLNSWDTSNVTDMSWMFNYSQTSDEMENLSLHIENWDTSNVTDMRSMFMSSNVGSLDLSNWNISNITDASLMFHMFAYNTSSPVALDLSNWQTSKLEDISAMFSNSHISVLNVDGWDTTNVVNMSNAFFSTYISELDLSSWNTPKVTDIRELFAYSEQLKTLDISSFDTSAVEAEDEGMGMGIFQGLEQIEQITLGAKSVFNKFETFLNTEEYVPSGRPYWEGQRTKAFYSSGEAFMKAYDGSQPDVYVRVSEQSPADNLSDAEISLLKSPGILCFVDVETEAQIRFADVTLNGREQEVNEQSGTQAKISVLDTRADKTKGWEVTVNYQDDNFLDYGLSMTLAPSATSGESQGITLAKSAQVFFSRGTAGNEENFQALLAPKLKISSLSAQTGEIRTGLNWTLVPEV